MNRLSLFDCTESGDYLKVLASSAASNALTNFTYASFLTFEKAVAFLSGQSRITGKCTVTSCSNLIVKS